MRKPVWLVLVLVAILTMSLAALAAESQSLAPTTKEKVFFRGWQYKTHIVDDNVSRYNTLLSGSIDYATVTGDYPTIMERNLIAKAPLDVLYANPSQAGRYYDGGWILPAEELPNIEQIKKDMYPNILDAWTYKGKLLGLSYFVSTRGMVHVNLKRYNELGFTDKDFPKNWDELYDQLFDMQKRGIDKPYLPHWFNEWYGISWAFVFEVHNRGGEVADAETHRPMVTVDGPAGETLRDWKRTWNAGLVPAEVLTYKESDYLQAWASGRFVFSPQQIYDLKTFNDPNYSQIAGYNSFLPYQGQSWGLLDSAMYLMTTRPRSAAHTEDVKRFASWYGYRDHEGHIFVGQRWLEESMLFSGYKPVMESPAAREVMEASMARPQDVDAALKVYAATPYPKGVWNVVWAEEFNSWLKETLSRFLLTDGDVEATIRAIRAKIDELNRKYRI